MDHTPAEIIEAASHPDLAPLKEEMEVYGFSFLTPAYPLAQQDFLWRRTPHSGVDNKGSSSTNVTNNRLDTKEVSGAAKVGQDTKSVSQSVEPVTSSNTTNSVATDKSSITVNTGADTNTHGTASTSSSMSPSASSSSSTSSPASTLSRPLRARMSGVNGLDRRQYRRASKIISFAQYVASTSGAIRYDAATGKYYAEHDSSTPSLTPSTSPSRLRPPIQFTSSLPILSMGTSSTSPSGSRGITPPRSPSRPPLPRALSTSSRPPLIPTATTVPPTNAAAVTNNSRSNPSYPSALNNGTAKNNVIGKENNYKWRSVPENSAVRSRDVPTVPTSVLDPYGVDDLSYDSDMDALLEQRMLEEKKRLWSKDYTNNTSLSDFSSQQYTAAPVSSTQRDRNPQPVAPSQPRASAAPFYPQSAYSNQQTNASNNLKSQYQHQQQQQRSNNNISTGTDFQNPGARSHQNQNQFSSISDRFSQSSSLSQRVDAFGAQQPQQQQQQQSLNRENDAIRSHSDELSHKPRGWTPFDSNASFSLSFLQPNTFEPPISSTPAVKKAIGPSSLYTNPNVSSESTDYRAFGGNAFPSARTPTSQSTVSPPQQYAQSQRSTLPSYSPWGSSSVDQDITDNFGRSYQQHRNNLNISSPRSGVETSTSNDYLHQSSQLNPMLRNQLQQDQDDFLEGDVNTLQAMDALLDDNNTLSYNNFGSKKSHDPKTVSSRDTRQQPQQQQQRQFNSNVEDSLSSTNFTYQPFGNSYNPLSVLAAQFSLQNLSSQSPSNNSRTSFPSSTGPSLFSTDRK
jgi:Tfp pilus assembly major pilin PilA